MQLQYETKTHKIHTDNNRINLRTVKWAQWCDTTQSREL